MARLSLIAVSFMGLIAGISAYPGYSPYNLGFYNGGNLGYGGGLSFTANLKPFNRYDPVDFAYGLGFGYGLDVAGHKLSDGISITGAGGNGIGSGYGYGGAQDGYGYGGGNGGSTVYGTPGYGQSFSNNMAFSNQLGNGYGSGNAVGQVIPTGW